MNAVPPPTSALGIPGLLGEALRGAGDVLRGEIDLFRQEMTENLRRLILGLATMAGAAVFAVIGFVVLLGALVKSLASFVGSEALSALIVGIAFLVIGVVLALSARSRFSFDGLIPTRTGRQLRQDAAVFKDHVTHEERRRHPGTRDLGEPGAPGPDAGQAHSAPHPHPIRERILLALATVAGAIGYLLAVVIHGHARSGHHPYRLWCGAPTETDHRMEDQ